MNFRFGTVGLVKLFFLRTEKSRAMRGFGVGGPTRTRTVDQRIMSCLETL